MDFYKIAAAIAVLLFVTVGVHNVVDNQNKLDLKNIQLKSASTQLKTLELKYDNLQIELNKTDKANTEQIKKLQDEKNQLEQERIKLQQELSAKKASKLQVAATTIPTQGTAYAEGGCSTWLAAAGVSDIGSATRLIAKESGCNPFAVNSSSGACGVAQELPCGKSGCGLGNGACQVRWMNSYVLARYGSWSAALAFHNANNWY